VAFAKAVAFYCNVTAMTLYQVSGESRPQTIERWANELGISKR
jgi:hypothetical protein